MMKVTSSWAVDQRLMLEKELAVDPRVYKFISIITSQQEIKTAFKNSRVVAWLKENDERVKEELKNEPQVRQCIRSVLRLSTTSSERKIRKRHWIALQYAKILEEHVPGEDGIINSKLNYLELVIAVEKIFILHIRNTEELFSTGMSIQAANKLFIAKIEKNKICMFTDRGILINEGGQGSVWEIYEISRRDVLAFKNAKEKFAYQEALSREIRILKFIKNTEGLQTRPLITLDLNQFYGYAGQRYGSNLENWVQGNPENGKRLSMCKSLMRAFASKTALGVWHGDLKDTNVVLKGDSCVIIDWAGALLFQKALSKGRIPSYYTKEYTNLNDRNVCLSLKTSQDAKRKDAFLKVAHAWDLFSTGMILFKLLTSHMPFKPMSSNEPWPVSWDGISKNAMQKLNERGYSELVNKTVIKMLADDYWDRYSDEEAIAIWEKI